MLHAFLFESECFLCTNHYICRCKILCNSFIGERISVSGYLFTQLIQLMKPEPFIYQASGIIVIIGILVGMIGSASAVRKYLKV